MHVYQVSRIPLIQFAFMYTCTQCVKMKAFVASQFGAMTAAFNEKVCECMGCCGDDKGEAGTCYYPVSMPQ